jgi:2-hydroxy-6-oxo-6-(2'-carboxyphenyl)-hexa-2,4-dienoate hydrolase
MTTTASLIHEAKFATINGINTRYYDEGRGDPMLLVHGARFGGIGSTNTWTRNIEGLSNNFHVYAPDRLGNGMTDNPKSDAEYTIEAVVSHLQDFMAHLGIKQVHLVGQSVGAYVACRLALENPGMTKSLVVTDTATLTPDVGNFAERLAKVNEGRPEGLREYIRFYWERMSYTTEHVTDDYVDAEYYMEALPKAVETREKMKAFGNESWRKSLASQKAETLQWLRDGRLQVPILICWAADDPSAVLEQGLELYQIVRQANDITRMYIVNRGGHFHYREYPDEFNNTVSNFIRTYAG